MRWQIEFQKEILKANDFSSAVRLLSKRTADLDFITSPPKISYAQLSRKMGLKSRSNVREICEKIKKPSKNFLLTFCDHYKLSATWREFFTLLYNLELNHEKNQKEFLKKKLDSSKNKIYKQLERKRSSKTSHYLKQVYIPLVYAALGSKEKGSNLVEIAKKTGLKENLIKAICDDLLQKGIVNFDNQRFYPSDKHTILETEHEDELLKSDLIRSLKNAINRLNNKIEPSDFYINSTFSVSKNDLPEIKRRLNQALSDFIDESESSDGDHLVQFTTLFYPARIT